MSNARERARTRRPASPATIEPLRSAISALAVASLLLGALAACHDDSPIARLMAERTTVRPHGPSFGPSLAPAHGRITPYAAGSVASNSISTESGRRAAAGMHGTPHLVPRSRDGAAHFLSASQSHQTTERGPAIRLGPPQVSDESKDAEASTSKSTAETAPLVTRTYRPVSMSAVSLERLVRPLLTGRGAAIASNAAFSNDPVSIATVPAANDRGRTIGGTSAGVAEMASQPEMLVVSDRPEAIGRIDALCRDVESHSPRIAIDLVVVSVVPATGSQLPWNQWRQAFGIVESDLPSVLNQLRGLGRASVRTRSQLQTVSGTWTELTCSEQSLVTTTSRLDLDEPEDRASADGRSSTRPLASAPAATTTLHVRPTSQADGIRLEVRAQASHTETRAAAEHPQLITVRFSTEVLLHEGSTGIVNLFVDEPFEAQSPAKSPSDAASATLVIPGGPSIPAAKIVPHPGAAEQTLLLLMPRIVDATCAVGKIAKSKTHDPS